MPSDVDVGCRRAMSGFAGALPTYGQRPIPAFAETAAADAMQTECGDVRTGLVHPVTS